MQNRRCARFISLIVISIFCISVFQGCANLKTSTQRLGRDLQVVGMLPVQATIAPVRDMGKDFGEHPVKMTIGAPFSFVMHSYKHITRSIPYLLDIALYPFYLPFGAKPIEIYDTSTFPFTLKGYSAADESINYNSVVMFAAPVGIIVGASKDTVDYVESHNILQSAAAPGITLLSTYRHLYYGLIATPVKTVGLFLTLPFSGSGQGKFHEGGLNGYPLDVKRGYNKGFNRMTKDAAVVATAPVQIVLHAGYDSGEVWNEHPVAGTIFMPVIFPYQAVRHTFLTLFHGVDFVYMATLGLADSNPTPFYLYRPGSLETDPEWEAYVWQQFGTFMMILVQVAAQAQAADLQSQANSWDTYNPAYAQQLRMQALQLQMNSQMMTPMIEESIEQSTQIMQDINEKLENYTSTFTARHYLQFLKGLTIVSERSQLFDNDGESSAIGAELEQIDYTDLSAKDYAIIKSSYRTLMDKYMMLRFEAGMEDSVSPQQRETYYLVNMMNNLITLIHLPFVDNAYDSLRLQYEEYVTYMKLNADASVVLGVDTETIEELCNYEYTADGRLRIMSKLLKEMMVQLFEINQIPQAERIN